MINKIIKTLFKDDLLSHREIQLLSSFFFSMSHNNLLVLMELNLPHFQFNMFPEELLQMLWFCFLAMANGYGKTVKVRFLILS